MCVQRWMRGLRLAGGVGVEEVEAEVSLMGLVVVVVEAGSEGEVKAEAMPPRSGSESVRVEEGETERLARVGVGLAEESSGLVGVVGVGVRCFPARWMRRFVAGMDVRSERSSRRVAMGVEDGRFSGMAGRGLVG